MKTTTIARKAVNISALDEDTKGGVKHGTKVSWQNVMRIRGSTWLSWPTSEIRRIRRPNPSSSWLSSCSAKTAFGTWSIFSSMTWQKIWKPWTRWSWSNLSLIVTKSSTTTTTMRCTKEVEKFNKLHPQVRLTRLTVLMTPAVKVKTHSSKEGWTLTRSQI